MKFEDYPEFLTNEYLPQDFLRVDLAGTPERAREILIERSYGVDEEEYVVMDVPVTLRYSGQGKGEFGDLEPWFDAVKDGSDGVQYWATEY